MTRRTEERFTPRLEILPPAQRALWEELGTTPEYFTLYGGTALALRLGHRTSVDFDFFSNQNFEPDRLAASIPYLRNAERLQVDKNTLTCRVDRGSPVLVSFFGGLGLGTAIAPGRPDGSGIAVASLLDISATKLSVIQKRAEGKDYNDLDALLRSGMDLPTMLAAGIAIYGPAFNPMISLKALSYFEDVPGLPTAVGDRLSRAAAAVDPTALPTLIPFVPPATAQ
jgi:hypothetical protein